MSMPQFPPARKSNEWIDHADGAVQASAFEIFAEDLVQSVIVRIRPHVRVEPRELVCSVTADRRPQQLIIRIENDKLAEQLFRLTTSI